MLIPRHLRVNSRPLDQRNSTGPREDMTLVANQRPRDQGPQKSYMYSTVQYNYSVFKYEYVQYTGKDINLSDSKISNMNTLHVWFLYQFSENRLEQVKAILRVCPLRSISCMQQMKKISVIQCSNTSETENFYYLYVRIHYMA